MNLHSPAVVPPETDADLPGNVGPAQETEQQRMLRSVEEMYIRQRQMEEELANTRSALNNAEAKRRIAAATAGTQDNASTDALLQSLTRRCPPQP